MYFPILRGKQFELIALRELCAQAPETFQQVCPIIEPVTKNSSPLRRTIEALNEIEITPFLILNPSVGEFEGGLVDLEPLDGQSSVIPTFLLNYENEAEVLDDAKSIGVEEVAILVPDGCSSSAIKELSKARYLIISTSLIQANKYNQGIEASVVLLEDGFKREDKNADYQKSSNFKSAVGEYKNFNLGGFSDYTITGQFFRDGGGPAYVVAIHLTELKEVDDGFGPEVNVIINHYISDPKSDSPKDPAAKFSVALENMFADVSQRESDFDNTIGMRGFKELHDRSHFSGLGVAKKLSILHHIQTLANFVKRHD